MLLRVVLGAMFAGLVMYLVWRAQWLGGYDPVEREYARFCRKIRRQRRGRLRGSLTESQSG